MMISEMTILEMEILEISMDALEIHTSDALEIHTSEWPYIIYDRSTVLRSTAGSDSSSNSFSNGSSDGSLFGLRAKSLRK